MIIDRSKLLRYTLLLFVFSTNFEMVNLIQGSGQLSVGRITGYLYILMFMLSGYKISFNRERNTIYLLFSLLFIILLSSALHLNIVSSTVMDLSLLQNVVLYFMLLIHEKYDPGILDKSILYLVIGTVILSTLFLFGIGVERSTGSEERLSLLGDNENMIGVRMVVGIMAIIYYINNSKNKVTIINIIGILSVGLMTMVMRETASRTAAISYVIVLFLLMYFHLRSDKGINKYVYVLSFALIVSLLAIPFLMDSDTLVTRLTKAKEGNFANREVLWQALLPAVYDSPYIGYGVSGFAMVSWQKLGAVGSPHNVFLEVLLYSGFIGLTIFLIFNINVLINSYQYYKKEGKYLGLLMMVPYLGMLIVGHTLVKKIMWIILAYNSIYIIKEQKVKKRQ